ncbi:hypothetical protein [Streptomyces noursei]|uniref:Proline rich protein membrane protein n=1 Tax=Streptomyces noursei TaxID=1971 RepID=A0A2N8PHI3_STRNR|nr:hypothetical protein [Streptomyces noursei]PNE40504.1 hypothetical protein AOB60_06170 [Streptomyces noursei]
MRLPHLHLSTHHHQHDHPVRRTSDRLQFGVDALLALVLLLALPSAAIAAGTAAYAWRLHNARTEAAERRLVTAHLTADTSDRGEQTPPSPLGPFTAPARWTGPDGRPHTTAIQAKAEDRKGTPVRIWVDRQDKVASAPPSHASALATGWLVGSLAGGLCVGTGYGARWAAALLLDRLRYRQWEAEWRRVEPRWSRRAPGS